jgi:Uma2 family endonuclease
MTTLVIATEEVHAVAGPPQGQWTYADWKALPDDGKRYEVIEGVLYMTTAPSNFHQWIVRRLERLVGIPAEDQGLALCFPAPIGVLMPGCDPVQPDYVVVLASNASIIRGGRIRGVPNLIIEVLSPGSVAYDQGVKLEAYARAGVPEYAIIDPAARMLSHYRLVAEEQYSEPRVFSEAETATFECLPTINMPIAHLFAGAPDTTLRIADE